MPELSLPSPSEVFEVLAVISDTSVVEFSTSFDGCAVALLLDCSDLS